MPTTLPPSADYTGAAVTQGGKKTFIAAVRQFLADCMGTDSTPQKVRNALGASDSPFRNRIFNGNCAQDTRNAGASVTITAGAALAWTLDLFYSYCTGANVSAQQITAADGTKRWRYTGAASATGIGHGYRMLAANSLDMAGSTCTFSVKLANTLLTTVNWAAYYATTANTFGTLASPTRTAIASGSFTVNSTEAVYAAQIAVPGAATTGIEIVLSVGAQTSGTWTMGELMFEKGSILAAAVNFERVDDQLNRQRCRQHYVKGITSVIGICYSAGAFGAANTIAFPAEMYSNPTVGITSASSVIGIVYTSSNSNVANTMGFANIFNTSSAANTTGSFLLTWDAHAPIQ